MRLPAFVLVLAAAAPAAGRPAEEPARFPITIDGKTMGYIDGAGTVVIPPRFETGPDEHLRFHDGLALVQEPGGQYGFIDASGRFALAPRFPWAGPFSEGLAFVETLDDRGRLDGAAYIDRSGRRVITWPYAPPEEGRLETGRRFSEGLAPVCWTKDTTTSTGPASTRIDQTRRWGYVDRTGKLVIPYQFEDAREFAEGRAPVQLGATGTSEWACGYIDRTGKVVVKGAWHSCDTFREGRALVMRFQDTTPERGPDRRYGYVDAAGTAVTPLRFQDAKPFSEGLACATEGGKAGFIERSGAWAIPPRYARCDSFGDGLAPVEMDGKWAFIDKTGRVAIPARFLGAHPFQNGLAFVGVPGEAGPRLAYIDKAGRVVWSTPIPGRE